MRMIVVVVRVVALWLDGELDEDEDRDGGCDEEEGGEDGNDEVGEWVRSIRRRLY
jgi:hypothetical protein